MTPQGRSAEPYVDPVEDAASAASLALAPAVEAIARTIRERHMAQRAAETSETTRTKVWKWGAGIATPRQGRHKA